jgi:8-oxo-dGTP pyrophosphatase MutT (NUDIX family)
VVIVDGWWIRNGKWNTRATGPDGSVVEDHDYDALERWTSEEAKYLARVGRCLIIEFSCSLRVFPDQDSPSLRQDLSYYTVLEPTPPVPHYWNPRIHIVPLDDRNILHYQACIMQTLFPHAGKLRVTLRYERLPYPGAVRCVLIDAYNVSLHNKRVTQCRNACMALMQCLKLGRGRLWRDIQLLLVKTMWTMRLDKAWSQ